MPPVRVPSCPRPDGTGKIRASAENPFCVAVWSAAVYWVFASTPVVASPIGTARMRSARVLWSNVADELENVAVRPVVVDVPLFREYVTVALKVGVNVCVSGVVNAGARASPGTAKTGSATEFSDVVAVTAGAAANAWKALRPENVCNVLLTVRVAPVMLIACVLVTAQVVGLVRKNLTSVS